MADAEKFEPRPEMLAGLTFEKDGRDVWSPSAGAVWECCTMTDFSNSEVAALIVAALRHFRDSATQVSEPKPDAATDPLRSFDARDWAREFVRLAREKGPEFATDEGNMIGWFANALMRGYDEHAWRQPAPQPDALPNRPEGFPEGPYYLGGGLAADIVYDSEGARVLTASTKAPDAASITRAAYLTSLLNAANGYTEGSAEK